MYRKLALAVTIAAVVVVISGLFAVKPVFAYTEPTEWILYIGTDGALTEIHYTNGVGFSTPKEISSINLANRRTSIAAVKGYNYDVYFVGSNGAIWESFYEGSGNWHAPYMITSPNAFPSNSSITADYYVHENVYAIGTDNRVKELYFPNNAGRWTSPYDLPFNVTLSDPSAPLHAMTDYESPSGPSFEQLYMGVQHNLYTASWDSKKGWLGPNVETYLGNDFTDGEVTSITDNNTERIFWVSFFGGVREFSCPFGILYMYCSPNFLNSNGTGGITGEGISVIHGFQEDLYYNRNGQLYETYAYAADAWVTPYPIAYPSNFAADTLIVALAR